MQRNKSTSIAASVILILALTALTGCGYKNGTAPPVPANVQIAELSKALADALSTANKSAMVLRDNGKITEKETLDIQEYIVVVANSGKAMDTVLLSPDPWPTQKTKIINIWSTTGIGIVREKLSPTGRTVLDTLINVINQILVAVGGPAI